MDAGELGPVAYQGFPQVAQHVAVAIHGLAKGIKARAQVRPFRIGGRKGRIMLDELGENVRVGRLGHNGRITFAIYKIYLLHLKKLTKPLSAATVARSTQPRLASAEQSSGEIRAAALS